MSPRVSLLRCQPAVAAIGAIGAGVLLAWWASPSGSHAPIQLGNHPAMSGANAHPAGASRLPVSTVAQPPGLPGVPPPLQSMAGQPAAATVLAAVPITVIAPQKLQVGEQDELVVGVGPNGGVGEISFSIQFEPNVLQARSGTEGDWAAGGGSTPFAEISDGADRVQIRGKAGAKRVGEGRGSRVAIVQFQAVASGTTSVMITGVTVNDLNGNPMPFSLSVSNLQVMVEAVASRSAARLPQSAEPEVASGPAENGD